MRGFFTTKASMTSTLITPPTSAAVDLASAKAELKVDGDYLDASIAAWIDGITAHAEHLTGRSFVSQTWRKTLPAFPYDARSPIGPQAIRLPSSPLIAISSVKYIDQGGAEQTLDPAAYTVDDEYLLPAYGTTWPSARMQANAVTVEGTFGYGTDHTAVPGGIKTYILACLAQQFDPAVRPEKDTVQSSFLERLLDRFKIYG
jgi:uncharacterized phiE125 gp8 family phage protein